MTKYFEQKEASKSPETFLKEMFGYEDLCKQYPKPHNAIVESINDYVAHRFIPVEPKGMKLEEVKDRFAKTKGYDDFKDASNSDFGFETLYIDDIADLYLSSNTAALREENEELKKQIKLLQSQK